MRDFFYVQALACHISDDMAILFPIPSSILLLSSLPSLKKVLGDPLMQDYWIKVQASCTNLPHNLLTSVSAVTYNGEVCDTSFIGLG